MNLLIAVCILFGAFNSFAQTSAPSAETKVFEEQRTDAVVSEKSNLFEAMNKALANTVRAEFAVAWDGREIMIARSDVEVHVGLGNRVEVFARINLLPYVGKNTIIERLKSNEDVINGVSAAIAQSVRNQIAAKLGVPADSVVVPQPVIQAAIAANLTSAVEKFVNSKITPEAQRDAALREIGVAVSLLGTASENNQLVFEIGKLDAMYSGSDDPKTDPTLSKNYFRLSRPAVRLKYRNEAIGLVTYVEVGNDAGLWEVANPRANAAMEYIATIVARSQGKFFDLQNVNSWELGSHKIFGRESQNHYGVRKRPVLERGADSKYYLGKYEGDMAGFFVDAQASYEVFEDPVFGDIRVKRYEAGISRDIKGFNVGAEPRTKYDSVLQKDFSTVMAGFNKGLLSFSNFTLGIGARAYVYKYHGVDDNGDIYTWQKGGDVGAGLTFGKPSVDGAEVLFEQNKKLSAQRLKENKKNK